MRTPALLTTTSSRPKRWPTASMQAATSSRRVTSVGSTTTSRPACAATSSSSALRRAATATWAPPCAKASAVARPMPLDAPVTRTTESRNGSSQDTPTSSGCGIRGPAAATASLRTRPASTAATARGRVMTRRGRAQRLIFGPRLG